MKQEDAYQLALRGYRTADRTGKPHIVRLQPTGDSERYLVSDPRHSNSTVVAVPSCMMAVSRKPALALLKEQKAYPA